MARRELPSPAALRQLLTYDPQTGKLFWRERPRDLFQTDREWKRWNVRYAGAEAFISLSQNGYRTGQIFGQHFRAHRVAFAIYSGRWPVEEIDHIDRDRTNNRISNLREASRQENQRNKSRPSTNTSGHTGVMWHKGLGRWSAGIGIGSRKTLHLGHFATREEAVAARQAAERAYDYHPAAPHYARQGSSRVSG